MIGNQYKKGNNNVNIHISNTGVPNFMKKRLLDVREQICFNTINSYTFIMERSFRKKSTKEHQR